MILQDTKLQWVLLLPDFIVCNMIKSYLLFWSVKNELLTFNELITQVYDTCSTVQGVNRDTKKTYNNLPSK